MTIADRFADIFLCAFVFQLAASLATVRGSDAPNRTVHGPARLGASPTQT